MPRGEGEATAEAMTSRLVTPKDEPSETTDSRLLSASSWMTTEAGPSTRGEFVASTIDVDAIKRSPERFQNSSSTRKEPLMTIPENWATIGTETTTHHHGSSKTRKPEHSEEDESESESNSDEEESLSSEDSGSECSGSSCSTCSDDDESEDSDDEDSDEDSSCSYNSSISSGLHRKSSAAVPKVKSAVKKYNKSRFIVESRSVVKASANNKHNNEHLEHNSSVLPVSSKGSVSQAEVLKQLVSVVKSSSSSSKATKSTILPTNSASSSSRKFFKRRQQQQQTSTALTSATTTASMTVTNGSSSSSSSYHRQHQPSHHHHSQTMANPNSSASGSCVMDRLGSVSHHQVAEEVHHHSHHHDQVGPEIDHHFADHLVQPSSHAASNSHSVATATSDHHHTFHPLSEGLQVIEDEDLVAILKDVSGETFHADEEPLHHPRTASTSTSDYDTCDKRLMEENNSGSSSKMMRKVKSYSTVDVVSEAIQRIDPSVSMTSSTTSVISKKYSDSAKAATNSSGKASSLSKVQSNPRQRHGSSKKKKAKSNFAQILPAPPDMDLYLNSNASNVSPDSGIQSEGGAMAASSSPLNQGSSVLADNALQQSASANFQFSPGSNSTATIYQWPQNGYFGDWTTTSVYNPPLMALVTPIQQVHEAVSTEVSILPTPNTTPRVVYAPTTLDTNTSSSEVILEAKRGRGRPKGSKNKKKKATMECGSQTVESSLEKGMSISSVSSPCCSLKSEDETELQPPVIGRSDDDDDDDQTPPPAMFMGEVDAFDPKLMRGRPRKDPPRLEPQVEVVGKRSGGEEVIILASADEEEDDDRSTIMFSDGEDDDQPPEIEVVRPKSPVPPVLDRPILEAAVVKSKKKKKRRKMSESESEHAPPLLKKAKKKKKSKSRNRDRSPPPPVLEPIVAVSSKIDKSTAEARCEAPPDIEFEEVPMKISPVVSPQREPSEEEHHELPPSKTEQVKPFSFGGDPVPVFSAKYRSLKVDKFWKKKKKPKAKAVSAVLPPPPPVKKPEVVKVATKAAVKEIPNIPLLTTATTPSTKTMLAVLLSTSVKAKPGRKKKGKEKASKKGAKDSFFSDSPSMSPLVNAASPGVSGGSISSKSPAFSPRSVTSSVENVEEFDEKKGLKKKRKAAKVASAEYRKHKNVIDPVLMTKIENLIQEFNSAHIEAKMSKDLWPDRPTSCLPSIFRKRKIITPEQQSSAIKGSSGSKRGRPKKPVVEKSETSQESSTSKASEQRLPLKKRHHHHQNNQSSDSSDLPARRASGAGRNSRKNSTEEKKSRPSEPPKSAQNKPLTPGTSPVKAINIVDSIAACVDKYTSGPASSKAKPKILAHNVSKELTQPLTVQVSNGEVNNSLGSPRKRHLLQMQTTSDLPPPQLEKIGVKEKSTQEEKRPSSPPKLSRFDHQPEPPVVLTSPISEEDEKAPCRSVNVYKPKVSDISEDDGSDFSLMTPPLPPPPLAVAPKNGIEPIRPKILKKPATCSSTKDMKSCSVRMTKLDKEESARSDSPSYEQGKARRKKKRKANRTGFPAVKKKKKRPTTDDGDGGECNKRARDETTKATRKKAGRKGPKQPLRASARIVGEDKKASETDSRSSSRLSEVRPDSPPKRSLDELAPNPKRSKLYEDIDENVDCLAVLPRSGMDSSEVSEIDDEKAPNSTVGKGGRRKKGGHLFKKNYLLAGLFSDFYKDLGTASAPPIPISLVQYNAEDHIHGLLPPPYYCGRQLRQKREDFTLPFDLWWQHMNKQLPGRDVAATWNYKKIKTNVYFDVAKPVAKGYEMQACQCKLPSTDTIPGCGEDCINRMTYTECDSSLCSLPDDRCDNRRIQRQKSSALLNNLERFMTAAKGWGIKTKMSIGGGDFIMEYIGEVVSEKEFKLRMLTEYVEDNHHYCLHLDGGMVIDGHRMGNECRFVNHSCEPNCEMQKWNVNGHYRMALFALRDIASDEELTYDYNFSLFNPHEGQICRCGSSDCRGVIGGKTQRIAVQNHVQQPSDHKRKKQETTKASKGQRSNEPIRVSIMAPMKPLTPQLKMFAREHHCFLLRNYEKVRVFREALQSLNLLAKDRDEMEKNNSNPEEMIMTGITALATARSMQTRRLAIAQDDPKVTKVVKLAQILREIFVQITNLSDDEGQQYARFFKELPSRKRFPNYYQYITDPVDFNSIERAINTGSYVDPDQFDKDVIRLLQNSLRHYGRNSPEGQAGLKIRKHYQTIKSEYLSQLEEIIAPEDGNLSGFRLKRPETPDMSEDIIDCLCGQFKDEGTMIQCEKCQIWQHLDCVESPCDEETPYFCNKCSKIEPNLDIKLTPQPEYAVPGETYYVSLMRDDLQIKLNDTVYVLRAFKEDSANENGSHGDNDESGGFSQGGIKHKMMSPLKGPSQEASTLAKGNYPTYKSVDPEKVSTEDMDILRVERLWINEKGERFAFGHHYLRPHETFHEPSRKFFRNEVFRVPIYEVLALDSIWKQCWVLDLNIFCKGRPIGAVEEDVYICEYRVDKNARLFNKISKPKFQASTKWFAFDTFDIRLRPFRNYTPHEVPEKWKSSGQTPRIKNAENDNDISLKKVLKKKPSLKIKSREKLDETLTRLLAKLPNASSPLDVSHLLEKRLRKKATNA